MIFVALCVDGLQAILTALYIGMLVTPFIDFCAWIGFLLWFQHVGIKRYMGMSMAAVAEFVPFLNAFPIWTGYIVYMIVSSRIVGLSRQAEGRGTTGS